MASLKEVKNRINSVKSTRQITSAMKMVASAKLHKAQARIEGMLPYQQKLHDILANFLGTDITVDSPFTQVRPVERVAVVAFSSNGSLCGAFNSNVARRLEQRLTSHKSLGKENILVYPIGKKVEEHVRKLGYEAQGSFQSLADKPSYQEVAQLVGQLVHLFESHQVDRVELVYHHFKSTGVQILTDEVYLPIDLEEWTKTSSATSERYTKDYIVEPSVPQLIADLLPKVLTQKLYTVALDSNASEHAARMLAMQTATDNANDLISDLTKQYNKTRQQAITNELLDIVGGSMK